MTVENARRFIKRAGADQDLRDELNRAPTIDAMNAVLEKERLPFTRIEFDEACSNLLAQSQTEAQAVLIREIKGWWEFLHVATQ